MKALKIKPEFHKLIEQGRKTTTIRDKTNLKEGDVFRWEAVVTACNETVQYIQEDEYIVKDVSRLGISLNGALYPFFTVNGFVIDTYYLEKTEGLKALDLFNCLEVTYEFKTKTNEFFFNGVIITFEKKKDPWKLLKEDWDIKDLLKRLINTDCPKCYLRPSCGGGCSETIKDRYGVEL